MWFRPQPALVRKSERSARMALAAMLLLMASFVVLAVLRAQWLILLGLALPLLGLAAITAVMYWMTRAIMNTAIGLRRNQLALRDHRGRESRSSLNHVVFSDAAIATRDKAVFLGQPRKSIYDRGQLEEQLIPHLGDATKISDWQVLAPRSWAGVLANAPLNEPTAVRAAEAITTLVMANSPVDASGQTAAKSAMLRRNILGF